MVVRETLKPALKRGALVAAANWPVVLIQGVADSLFKALVAMPLVGGTFLVALVVGADPAVLLSLEWRELLATMVASLMSRPVVLVAFLASLSIVIAGGSLFVFLVKGGTVGVLVRGERAAGPIEQPPLRLAAVARASRFSIEGFVDSARALFPRYARLGLVLIGVYLGSAAAYFGLVFASRGAGAGWAITALATAVFVAWITVVNLGYLLMQVVIAADDCSVAAGWRRAAAFVRREAKPVAAVFLVVLAVVVFATGASFVATTALGLIAFIPLVGLTVLPLQLVAWLFRALVFQYIGLSSIGAYLQIYRASGAAGDAHATGMIGSGLVGAGAGVHGPPPSFEYRDGGPLDPRSAS